MCDLRGRTRKLFAENAKEYYVNGENSWPDTTNKEQLNEHKLTDNDRAYGEQILLEWLLNGGKLLNKKDDKGSYEDNPIVVESSGGYCVTNEEPQTKYQRYDY